MSANSIVQLMSRSALVLLLCFAAGIRPGAAAADLSATSRFDIQPQQLPSALLKFSEQSGIQVTSPGTLIEERSSPGVVGTYDARYALERLLTDTTLGYDVVDSNTVVIIPPRGASQRTTATGGRSRAEAGLIRVAQSENSAAMRKVERSSGTRPSSGSETPSELTSSEADGANFKGIPEIVVTGSHIRGVAPVGSQLIVIDREDIQASGHGRVQDFLETLPQNFNGSASEDSMADPGAANYTRGQAIDLRGLGASSTLVLVNGRRQPSGGLEGSYVDISSIATSAIERIEVLPDGASALYGSDAIGGVVNFVLRKDYEGLETAVRLATIDGAAEDLRVSQLAGRSWVGGNFLVGYQYSHRDALMVADTPYSSMNGDFRSMGGRDFRTPASNPGTILDPITRRPAFAIPRGQDGTQLSLADLLPGQVNYLDSVTDLAALPEQTQHSAFFTLSQALSERFDIFVEGRYNRREMQLAFANPASQLAVPASNPFYVNPFGTGPVRVFYSFREDLGGVATQLTNVDTYSLATGGTAQLGREWRLSTVATYGREHNAWQSVNDGISFARRDAALADPNPATALNVFGDGSHTNPETINNLRSVPTGEGESTVSLFSGIADGPLFRLPAGLAKLAIGVDYRDERLDAERATFAPATGIVVRDSSSVGQLERQVTAVFGELLLPILSAEGDPARARKLELALAARYEDYSDFGSTFNPKIGLNFTPLDSVKLRASWGTSFRAPRFNELSRTANPNSAVGAFGVSDPRSPTGRSNILLLGGANSDLREETAEVWTAGFDLTPNRLPGLIVSGTYFNVNYEDKIQRGGSTINTLLLESQWAEIISRDPIQAQIDAVCNSPHYQGTVCPSPVAAIVDARLRNLGGVKVLGADFNVEYRTTLSLGSFSLGVSGTRVLKYERAVSSTAPFIDILDTVGNPLNLRLRGAVSWSFNQWAMNVSADYDDGYRDTARSRKVASWTRLNSSVSYRFDHGWMDGTDILLSANNVMDEKPPFVNSFRGFDTTNASEIGRSMSVSITKRW